jgi:hypothetical protein
MSCVVKYLLPKINGLYNRFFHIVVDHVNLNMLVCINLIKDTEVRHNYLNNKDILKEIHKSKNTYCCFTDPEDHAYDMILPDVAKINKKNILQGRKNRAERLAKLAHEEATKDGVKRKLDEFEIKLKDIISSQMGFF